MKRPRRSFVGFAGDPGEWNGGEWGAAAHASGGVGRITDALQLQPLWISLL